jgi:GntR family transcriptional regulator
MTQLFQDIRLDKSVPVPLYYQLKRQLLALIEGGQLKDGDMIPSEKELSELLEVSRPTLRQALGELVNEGCLRRHKGRGTFVAKAKVEERFLSKLESFDEEMRQKGMAPRTQVLDLKQAGGNGEAAEQLMLPPDEPFIWLRRLRFADGIPLVCVETFLSYRDYPELMAVDYARRSLYASMEALYGLRVDRVKRVIETVNIKKQEAILLQIPAGQAAFLVKTRAFAAGGERPVEFSVAHYRGDLNKFYVELSR